jgi:ribosome modulation factor
MNDIQFKDLISSDAALWPKVSKAIKFTKAMQEGSQSCMLGKPISTCPKLPKKLRKEWLSGWKTARAFTNTIDMLFHNKRKARNR